MSPFRSGRQEPISLAVVPASLVSVIVTAARLKFVRLTLSGPLDEPFSVFAEGEMALGGENWAALAPELLWPMWGFALGVATLAYY